MISFNDSDFQRVLNKLAKNIDAINRKGLKQMADELKKDSDQQIPKDTKKLVGTGKVEVNDKESSVSYNTIYAAYQHEGGDGKRVVRNYTTSGTKKKYLEDPLKQGISKWIKIYADNIK